MRRLVLVVAIVLPAVSVAKTTARMPGPAPIVRGYDAVALNAQCEHCHSEIAKEWRASLHHEAYSSDVFQRALAREPEPFCRGCHAPEANPFAPAKEHAALGVGCVTCHVLDRAPLAIPSDRKAPHPVARETTFASPSACASCHEFAWPDNHKRKVPAMLQSTASEHAKGPNRDKRCATCHMPIVDGHRSHRFVASRDPEFVKRAVVITAKRTVDAVSITLTAADALGHAFPTGDLFRRIAIVVEADGVKTQRAYLSRKFGPREELPGVVVRAELADDRVTHDAPRTVTFPMLTKATVRYRVVYERVEHDDVVEGSIELARGVL